MNRHVRTVALLGVLSAAAAVSAVALVIMGGADDRTVATFAGLAAVLLGAALGTWSHAVAPPDAVDEPREQKGPRSTDRRRLLRVSAGVAAAGAAGLAVPAARRIDRVVEDLRTTRWSSGVRVVDANGVPVVLDEVGEGTVLTVFPEHWAGDIDSQAVLIREPPERFTPGERAGRWIVDGAVIYSKLCTHMACSLGLYQQRQGTLLCPCHQAAFDVLDGGLVVSGPARRALPRLPFERLDDGHLAATGDFSDAVGAGFWWRP